MPSSQYIEHLQMTIGHLHGCDSAWLESVPVHEVFRGQTVWQGVVEVFTLRGHPKAKKAYVLAQLDGPP